MPENAQETQRGWFTTMVWKSYPDIEKSAEKYGETPLFKSDRAKLVYFFVVIFIISIAIAALGGKRNPANMEEVLWEGGIIGFLCIFILMGHRWAIGLAILMYTADKIILMMPPTSAQPVSQIIFGLICWHLGSTAIRVEVERKRRAKSQMKSHPPTINS
jgi:hypothetical protein